MVFHLTTIVFIQGLPRAVAWREMVKSQSWNIVLSRQS